MTSQTIEGFRDDMFHRIRRINIGMAESRDGGDTMHILHLVVQHLGREEVIYLAIQNERHAQSLINALEEIKTLMHDPGLSREEFVKLEEADDASALMEVPRSIMRTLIELIDDELDRDEPAEEREDLASFMQRLKGQEERHGEGRV